MSYCKTYGKDKVMFVTKEDHAEKSGIVLPESEQPGLLLSNGEINWNCPCLGGMATGPCGVEFREAFSCFHFSEAEPKGSDCYETFKTMQDCMKEYPTVYSQNIGDDDKEAGLGLDLDFDDDILGSTKNSEYADGDEEAKEEARAQKKVEVVGK